jgi:hypothetical protein
MPVPRLRAAAAALLLVTGCATAPEPPEPALGPAGEAYPHRLTLALQDPTFGEAVRRVGQEMGGRFALMNGLEDRPLGPVSFVNAPLHAVAEELATQGGAAVQTLPAYTFYFAPGYEPLTRLQLSAALPERYRVPASVQLGAGVPVYAALAWLSDAYGVTLVADNAVAQAGSGEVALRDVPLAAALEAVLKSARIADVRVEATPDYVFFAAPANPNPPSALLNPALPTAKQELLARRVSLRLPEAAGEPGAIATAPGPQRLGDVVEHLAVQINTPVVATPAAARLPVNPAVMVDVPMRTALDLLVRQWLSAGYGYEVTRDRIVFRMRRPGEMPGP